MAPATFQRISESTGVPLLFGHESSYSTHTLLWDSHSSADLNHEENLQPLLTGIVILPFHNKSTDFGADRLQIVQCVRREENVQPLTEAIVILPSWLPQNSIGFEVCQIYTHAFSVTVPNLEVHWESFPSFRAILQSSLQNFCWCPFSIGDSWGLVFETHLDCDNHWSPSSSRTFWSWSIRPIWSVLFCSLFHRGRCPNSSSCLSALHQLSEFCHCESWTSSFLVESFDAFL